MSNFHEKLANCLSSHGLNIYNNIEVFSDNNSVTIISGNSLTVITAQSGFNIDFHTKTNPINHKRTCHLKINNLYISDVNNANFNKKQAIMKELYTLIIKHVRSLNSL